MISQALSGDHSGPSHRLCIRSEHRHRDITYWFLDCHFQASSTLLMDNFILNGTMFYKINMLSWRLETRDWGMFIMFAELINQGRSTAIFCNTPCNQTFWRRFRVLARSHHDEASRHQVIKLLLALHLGRRGRLVSTKHLIGSSKGRSLCEFDPQE